MALLRHLAIRCNCMETSREFYVKCIGWKFLGYRPRQVGLDLSDGTNNITLLQQPTGTVRPEQEEGNEYIHFGVFVEDLQACWDRCKVWGATISKDNIKERNKPNHQECPPDSFKVLDPDGNIVDITANREEWCGTTL